MSWFNKAVSNLYNLAINAPGEAKKVARNIATAATNYIFPRNDEEQRKKKKRELTNGPIERYQVPSEQTEQGRTGKRYGRDLGEIRRMIVEPEPQLPRTPTNNRWQQLLQRRMLNLTREEMRRIRERERYNLHEQLRRPNHFYTIRQTNTTRAPNMQAMNLGYRIVFDVNALTDEVESNHFLAVMRAAFESIYDHLHDRYNLRVGDRMTWLLQDFVNPMGGGFMPANNFNIGVWLNTVAGQLQSWKDTEMRTPINLEVQIVQGYHGGNPSFIMQSVKDADRKRSIQNLGDVGALIREKTLNVGGVKTKVPDYTLCNKYRFDQTCLIRSIYIALAFKRRIETPTKETIAYYKKLIDGRDIEQWEVARKFYDIYNMGYSEQCGIEEAQYLSCAENVKIKVIDVKNGSQLLDFSYSYIAHDAPSIYLYYHEEHYRPITSMKSFYNCKYYCESCEKKCFNGKHEDPCTGEKHCKMCGTNPVNHQTLEVKDWSHYCNKCFRNFPTADCYYKHLDTTCNKVWRCQACKKTFDRKNESPEKHRCGYKDCVHCGKYVNATNHLCNMVKIIPNDVTEKIIWYDFECRLDEIEGTDPVEYKHTPNCVVALRAELETKINNEGVTETTIKKNHEWKIFYDSDQTVKNFGDWLFDKAHKGYTCIAHNSSGYDSIFLVDYCTKNGIRYPHRVYAKGNKLSYMYFKDLNMRFIDSLNFVQVSLRELPATFGFEDTKKGDYPYTFNTKENENYDGEFPELKFFKINEMKAERSKEVEQYYNEAVAAKRKFNNRDELISYCVNDVFILMQAWMKFRDIFLFLSKGVIDPTSYVSISSTAMALYRSQFLEDDLIGIINQDRLDKDNASAESLKFLEFCNKRKTLFPNLKLVGDKELINRIDEISQWSEAIQHEKNGGEVHIVGYPVDGFMKNQKTVVQYHGCFWHGCPECYPKRTTINEKNKKNMAELYQNTQRVTLNIKTAGYKVIEVWSHEWEKLLKDNSEVKTWIESLKIDRVSALDPRLAFTGARNATNIFYYKCKENEIIKFVDFKSLYPDVMKRNEYPVGHPVIYLNPKVGSLAEFKGLIKCDILPPKRLFHPVLCLKMDKSVFPLCYTCAIEKQGCECNHSEEKRMLRGTWTHVEIAKAVQKGYKVKEIHEVHHFEKWTKDLFAGYINTFYKIKQESEGYPEWVQTEEDKDKYINDFYEREQIMLDRNKIMKNKGLRTVAKLILNCLWGKFGQNESFPSMAFFTKAADFRRVFDNPDNIIQSVRCVSENCVLMHWENKKQTVGINPNLNLYISIFTAAYGRLKLYEIMDKVGKDVIYYDTDSLVYIVRDGVDPLKEDQGDYLGQLAVEHDDIIEWVSTGPKSYAFLKRQPDKKGILSICKMKGFTLDVNTTKKINLREMVNLIKNEEEALKNETPNIIETERVAFVRSYTSKKINLREIENSEEVFETVRSYTQQENKQPTMEIRTVPRKKTLRVFVDTRVMDWDNFQSYPFGY